MPLILFPDARTWQRFVNGMSRSCCSTYGYGDDHILSGRMISPPLVAELVEAASPNRWLFSGKESQSFLSASVPLLDFGARMYNPAIARWTAADPLSEKYYGISPYVYCLGNPISIIDPNGESTWVTRWMNGTFIVTDKAILR